MGLTENTPTALLALNGLDVRPNSVGSAEGMEAGLVGEEEAPDMAREFAYWLAKRAYGFHREPVGRA